MKVVFILILLLCSMSVILGGLCCKLYYQVRRQNKRVADLLFQVDLLRRGTDEEANAFLGELESGGVNLLALGNSITRHGLCDYWWNEIGMAATGTERDYFHLLVTGLKERYDNVNSFAYNFSQWEISDHDRSQTIKLIDDLLGESIDIIILQLGENISNTETLESDFEYLLKHIKEQCPNTQIIVVGNFWEQQEVEEIKTKVATKLSLSYVSLRETWRKNLFQSRIGTVVYDAKGNPHTVEHAGVARHPGDVGMKYIATKILECIKNNGSE